MFIEKKRKSVSPRLFTSNGSSDGIVIVADARDFFVKQRVQIVSDAQTPITVEIKRFISNNSFRVGPIGDSIHSKANISAYLVADNARISAEEQDRPGIADKDYNRAVYAEEPIVAKRVIQVDEHGNYYNAANPLPVELTGAAVEIDNVYVQLSHLDNFPNPGNIADSVRIGDGTNVLVVEPDGSINVNAEIVDPVQISDGTDILAINPDGSINVSTNIVDPISLAAEDSFGRVKVAQPHLLFDVSFQYSLQSEILIIQELLGATVTHNTNKAAAVLTCSATSSSKARYRTRNYFPYSPAFTNTMIASFNLNGHVANITKRIGLFDDSNGFFLQSNGSTLQVGIRSSTSGVAVDTVENQSSWNLDPLDGTGPSGITIDPTKQQIMYLQYQWLGSGAVVFGFIINGALVKVHQFTQHANVLSSLYSQTGTLPIFAEVINNGGASSYMEFTCCSLVSNGAMTQHGHLHSASSGITPRHLPLAGVAIPIISIRKRPGYNKIPAQILDMTAFSTSQDDFLIQIVHRPTLVGAVWAPINTTSFCDKDVSATSYSGGHVIAEFYMKGNLQASETLQSIAKFWDLTLGDDFSGASEIFSMVATPLTTNSTIYGIISYKEFE